MCAPDYIQGVIYDGSLVAVFSALRTGPGWDTAGRAAKYYALVFIERELWWHVNFDILLQNPFFLSPDNPPAISHRNTRCVDRAGKYFLEYAA